MPRNHEESKEVSYGLTRYLSPISVWALAFGCSVGWGAFVMPGTTFLPGAGPFGTVLGIALGTVVMLFIGMNYHYLMNRYPDAGGTLTYTARAFGYDHGFLSSWFLVLVYVAIIWANATALTLIARYLLGNTFQFGFHYEILGYDVYFGETLLTIAAILLFGCICIAGKKLAGGIQTVMAVILLGGILISFFAVMGEHEGGLLTFEPAYAPGGGNAIGQVLGIIILAPWAFVGFESVSHSTEEFTFPVKKTMRLMAAALVTGALSYIMLSEVACAILPEEYDNWASYTRELGSLGGLKGLPVFYAVGRALGTGGLIILGITVLAAIITGLIGNYTAASRLLYAMSREGILPEWFGVRTQEGTPKNALLFLMAVSVGIPFLGRTAIGWIVDVTT
ncbi:MAG: APC family permease, partial [Lachnospiraceae bacterium]|nr:APC family permease [Lachnospiraceae bacterium]